MEKYVMRRDECSKIYWKILLCISVLLWVCIGGVWKQTLILVTLCIWPWRHLSLSLSEAAVLMVLCQPTPFMTPLNPLSEIPPAFKCTLFLVLKRIHQRVCLTEQLHLSSTSIWGQIAFYHSLYEFSYKEFQRYENNSFKDVLQIC